MAKKQPTGAVRKGETESAYWLFPSTNHGEEDGFFDAQLEYFQGDHEKHVARETIQNAVDQRLDYGKPASVAFERFTMPAVALPGHAAARSRT